MMILMNATAVIVAYKLLKTIDIQAARNSCLFFITFTIIKMNFKYVI